MSWRGTLLLLFVAATALLLLLLPDRSHTRSTDEPLFGIDPSLAEKIIIAESGREITLLKNNGVWWLHSEINDRADPSLVHDLLQTAVGIVPLDTLHPKDLKDVVSLEALDLKTPKRSITIDAGKKEILSIGIQGPAAGQLYARLSSERDVFLIPSKIEAAAFRPEEEFRDKRLTRLTSDHLAGVTFSKGGGLQQIVLRKSPRGWNLESPVQTAADQERVIAWMNTLLGARIDHWMPAETDPANCGLDAPLAVIIARSEGEENPVTMTIGSATPGSTTNFYARCSDRPGICVVSAVAPALEITATELRSKQLKPLELDSVDRIEINQPRRSPSSDPLVLERKKGSEDWERKGKETGTIAGAKVGKWFAKLQGVRAEEFEPATPEHLQRRGLVNPTVIRLVALLSENTAEENAGKIVLGEYSLGTPSNGVVALREGNSPDLMIVPEPVMALASGDDLKGEAVKR